jgi:hypothetical protein
MSKREARRDKVLLTLESHGPMPYADLSVAAELSIPACQRAGEVCGPLITPPMYDFDGKGLQSVRREDILRALDGGDDE